MVTIRGILTRLHCPFYVKALQDVGPIEKGQKYRVDRVAFIARTISYEIDGEYYRYRIFRIL